MMTAQQFLNTININDKPRAYLICGVAGAGKITLANKLSEKGFKRFSIDEFIWLKFGKYGIDYEADQYAELRTEAEYQLELEIVTALKQKLPLVIDYSFWKRSNREKYKLLIERFGMEWSLLFLKTDYNTLKNRLKSRSLRFDANAAFPISEELLNQYYSGFEEPYNEGEIIILPD